MRKPLLILIVFLPFISKAQFESSFMGKNNSISFQQDLLFNVEEFFYEFPNFTGLSPKFNLGYSRSLNKTLEIDLKYAVTFHNYVLDMEVGSRIIEINGQNYRELLYSKLKFMSHYLQCNLNFYIKKSAPVGHYFSLNIGYIFNQEYGSEKKGFYRSKNMYGHYLMVGLGKHFKKYFSKNLFYTGGISVNVPINLNIILPNPKFETNQDLTDYRKFNSYTTSSTFMSNFITASFGIGYSF